LARSNAKTYELILPHLRAQAAELGISPLALAQIWFQDSQEAPVRLQLLRDVLPAYLTKNSPDLSSHEQEDEIRRLFYEWLDRQPADGDQAK
jgi:hypothetical protein